jgi:hypothetical protein
MNQERLQGQGKTGGLPQFHSRWRCIPKSRSLVGLSARLIYLVRQRGTYVKQPLCGVMVARTMLDIGA